MKQEDIKKLLEIGVLLSAERDLDCLLDKILVYVMEMANCDGGTLYILKEGQLHFKIMRTNSMGVHSCGSEQAPSLPPVPLLRENVCAFSLLEGRTVAIEDVRNCREYDFSGPARYDTLTGYRTRSIRSMLVVPMQNREGEKLGVIQLINALDSEGNVQAFPPDIVLPLESVASQAAITIQNVRYIQEIKEVLMSFVRAMSAAVDERSPYNANHSRRMAEMGERFVDFLNARSEMSGAEIPFPQGRKDELIMSIWLHDIGKLTTPLEVMDKAERLSQLQKERISYRLEGIRLRARIACLEGRLLPEEAAALERETIEVGEKITRINSIGFLPDAELVWLNSVYKRTYIDEGGQKCSWLADEEYEMLSIRKGTLSDRERRIMEEHAAVTEKLLSRIRFSADLSHVREWASAHHELLNGSGYPNRLREDEIPAEVRIITILDIFDALVADDRPYKPGMPVERALSILDSMANKEGKLDRGLTALFAESRSWESPSVLEGLSERK